MPLTPLPYGCWPSPITAELVAGAATSLSEPRLDGDTAYWLERRPQEQGRTVLMRCRVDGTAEEVTGPSINLRSRANEYGGGSYAVDNDVIYYCDNADQRIYRQRANEAPQAITPTTTPARPQADSWRYADLTPDPTHQQLIAVFEDHSAVSVDGETGTAQEPQHSLIAIDLSDSQFTQHVLASGDDFYSSPVLSDDGNQLAWLSWNHPNLPWDHTHLWQARFDAHGQLQDAELIAGQEPESIFQPGWSPSGALYFVSDRSNWWNLYRVQQGGIEAVCPMDAEFGLPQWVFGMRTWGFANHENGVNATEIIALYSQNGLWQATRICLNSGERSALKLSHTQYNGIAVHGNQILSIAASARQSWVCSRYQLDTQQQHILNSVTPLGFDSETLSIPESLEYPSEECRDSHALYYRPTNPQVSTTKGELPPLLVKTHGGPTAATGSALDLSIQYWTSRGFAVLDINYGGSTGYGRAYRQRLYGQWGEVDVDDCVNGALWLVQQGEVDKHKLAIRGSSAGGYTTLAALTFRNVFKAGASYYGIGDLEALVRDTHKFEARYLDQLIGPYPQRQSLYQQRSPIHSVDQLSAPVIFFQGLKDKVVPPQQAEAMVAALQAKQLDVEYLSFADEGHGFRQADTLVQCLEAELAFYIKQFGLAT